MALQRLAHQLQNHWHLALPPLWLQHHSVSHAVGSGISLESSETRHLDQPLGNQEQCKPCTSTQGAGTCTMSDQQAHSWSSPSINSTNQLDQQSYGNLILCMQFPPGINTQHGFACSGHHHYQANLHTTWAGQQLRGYKSLKKSMKPINNRASRLAVEPFLPPKIEQSQDVPQPCAKDTPVIDTVLPPLPKAPVPTEFRRIARITGEYMLDLQPAFAVVQIQGTQFKVTVDDILFVNHIKDAAVNEVLALDRVMLFGSKESTSIGRPYVPNTSVLVAVEEHFRDGELHVFKFKKRNRYKKYHTYRHAMTALRVVHITKDSSTQEALASLKDRIPLLSYQVVEQQQQGDQQADS